MRDHGIQVKVSLPASMISLDLVNVESRLTDELKSWLDSVPGEHHAVKGARVIIAP
jgi:hypothetical protein